MEPIKPHAIPVLFVRLISKTIYISYIYISYMYLYVITCFISYLLSVFLWDIPSDVGSRLTLPLVNTPGS